MAPEMLNGDGYDHGVDWWAFGVLMCLAITGCQPFEGSDRPTLFRSILEDAPMISSSVSADTFTLLSSLLIKIPDYRLGGDGRDAEDVKAHSFFGGIAWDRIASRTVAPPSC